jgi:uncharacterized membrane protein YGL010W
MKNKGQEIRPIDRLFNKYSQTHQNSANKLIQFICVPLITFGLLGLVWSIPFPHFNFLGKFNGFINWASFLIAFSIYYYLRLSPILSYGVLLIVFLFSGIIVFLEKMHIQNNWPPMWFLCFIVFVIAGVGQFLGHKKEGKNPAFFDNVKFLLIGPIWLLHFLCKKAGVRY